MRNRNEIPKQTAANKAKITLSVGKLKAIIHQAYKQGGKQALFDICGEVPDGCDLDAFEVRKTYVRSVVALACIHGDVPDAPISTAYRDACNADIEAVCALQATPHWPRKFTEEAKGLIHAPFGGQQITVLAVDEADADEKLRGILDRMPMVEGQVVETVSLIHPMFKEPDNEAAKVANDVLLTGVGFMYNGKRLDPTEVVMHTAPVKDGDV